MKGFLLLISCLLLIHFYSMHALDKGACMAENSRVEVVGNEDSDVVYDQDVAKLLATYHLQNDDFTASHLNHISRHLRLHVFKIQQRYENFIMLLKQLAQLLSVHLTTLINHTFSSNSISDILCWQYAADRYVFAFRHIII